MSGRVYQPESKASDYFLGDWKLCLRTNALSRGEHRVELENRLVLLLVFFIEQQGEVLGKERILKTIWQGKVVNDDSLAVAISHLRKALGDNSRAPEYIKTLPGVGYQLIARAGVVPSGAEAKPAATLAAEPESISLPAALVVRNRVNRFPLIAMAGLLVIIAVVIYWREAGSDSAALRPTTLAPSDSVTALLDHDNLVRWNNARQQLASWSPDELKSAIQTLRELLQQVPAYAPAYAAIAQAKIKLLQEQLGQKEHCAEVMGLLNKSLALDAQQQQVRVTRGNVLFWCARDYAAAEQDYLQAISLNPNDDVAPMQYAQLLLAQGKFTESLQQVENSRALNPLNYSVPTVVWIYQMQKRDDLALKELERINSAEPGDKYFHISAQRVYARMGRDQESLQHWLWLMRDASYSEEDLQSVQTAFTQQGLAGVNRWLLTRKDQVDLGQYTPPLSWARYALAAGEVGLAMDYLERAFADRQSPLLWGNVDPAYDAVRNNPRFQAIMQQVQQAELIAH